MDKSDILQQIPIDTELTYTEVKEWLEDDFHDFQKTGSNIKQSVNSAFYYGFDNFMDENGMMKLVAMIAGLLFEIEHNEVDPDQAYGTAYDIRDFETGDYDHLFTPDDLKLIKADIKKIKRYLKDHQELTEDIKLNYDDID